MLLHMGNRGAPDTKACGPSGKKTSRHNHPDSDSSNIFLVSQRILNLPQLVNRCLTPTSASPPITGMWPRGPDYQRHHFSPTSGEKNISLEAN